jgi:carboxypeptidase PM20D1
MLKKLLLGLVGIVVLLVAILAINTVRKGSRQIEVAPLATLAVDEAAAASRLGEAVRFRTVSSREDAKLNADQYAAFQAFLGQRFPKVKANLKWELMDDMSLLLTWQGSDAKAKPIMLMAHQDVVPVAPGTEKDWTVEPFSGLVRDGFIWGRGAWDNKGNLLSQLEAIEMLLGQGYKPERTVFVFMGAHEEVGDSQDAIRMAALLKSRGHHMAFVLDEGLLVTDGIMPGVDKPVSLVGIAEKGYVTVVLNVKATPGHSSMPPPKGTGAIAMMSAALKRVDDAELPGGIRGVAQEMFDTLAPEMNGFSRLAMSNLWLFGPVVQKKLEAINSGNAMLHTTTALTIANAGNKENVMPGRAEALVNYRLLPGDTAQSIVDRQKELVGSVLPADKFEVYALPGAVEASAVAPTDSPQYRLLSKTIREVFPDSVVAPGLMIGGTDSTFMGPISDHIYKFSPVRAKPEDLGRFHGTNERISIANYTEAIRFYHRLVSEGAKASAP